ncbi:hypothetical protein BGZ49_010614, partial [Haplosporangium sp. Z 27]
MEMTHPLELHEIRLHIGSYLRTKYLIVCACVSRDWYSTFSVLIWRNISLRNPRDNQLGRPLPTIEQIQAHSSHIYSLAIRNQLPNEYYELNNLTRLESLKAELCLPRPLHFLGNLIENHSSSLKVFKYVGHPKRIFFLRAVDIDPIGRCHNLRKLSLSNIGLNLADFKALLIACANIGRVPGEGTNSCSNGLVTLRLKHVKCLYTSTNIDFSSNFAPIPSLEKIYIQQAFGPRNNFMELLAHCSNIKSFGWKGSKDRFSMDQWVECIESGMWPRLKRLDILGPQFHDEGLARVIKSIPSPLEKLRVTSTGFWFMAFDTLLATERHYKHIQELDFLACPGVTSDMIQKIMTMMPALTFLSADHLHVTDIVDAMHKKPYTESSGRDWVCNNLRVLKLFIEMEEAPDPITPEYENRQRQVYQRLGKLTKLETLDVSRKFSCTGLSDFNDLRRLDHKLSAGLGHLASLKQLRKFLFSPGQSLTMEEIEWMISSWKCLNSVSRCMNPDQEINEKLKE